LVLSDGIFVELPRVLDKPYFARRLTVEQRRNNIELLRQEAVLVPLTATVSGVAPHSEDDLILATAVSARVDYLVTGDRRLRERVPSYEGSS
jgi:predicted nucleic acid-binding protein